MFIYIILLLLAFSGVATGWYFDQEYMHLGFYFYHVFPIFMFLITLMCKRKIEDSNAKLKLIVVGLFFALWLTGVWYISEII